MRWALIIDVLREFSIVRYFSMRWASMTSFFLQIIILGSQVVHCLGDLLEIIIHILTAIAPNALKQM